MPVETLVNPGVDQSLDEQSYTNAVLAYYRQQQRLLRMQHFLQEPAINLAELFGWNRIKPLLAKKGEVWGLLGGKNAGKTTLLLKLMLAMVEQQEWKVAFITANGHEMELSLRLIELKTSLLRAQWKSDSARIIEQHQNLFANIRWIPMSMNAERHERLRLRFKEQNFVPDVWIIDPIQLIESKTEDYRFELERYCTYLKQLSVQQQQMVWTSSQLTKEAEKRCICNSRLPEYTDCAEASGIYQMWDGAFSMDAPQGVDHPSRRLSLMLSKSQQTAPYRNRYYIL